MPSLLIRNAPTLVVLYSQVKVIYIDDLSLTNSAPCPQGWVVPCDPLSKLSHNSKGSTNPWTEQYSTKMHSTVPYNTNLHSNLMHMNITALSALNCTKRHCTYKEEYLLLSFYCLLLTNPV